MIPVTSFAGKRVALFGLGGSGLATAEALVAGGAEVVAYDDGETARVAATARGITVEDLRGIAWDEVDALVLSPGVPLTHPEPHWTVPLARAAEVEIIGDVELFCRERAKLMQDVPFIAVTGTNGKSTTTALTAHLLKVGGLDVQTGGNIGTPVLALEPFSAGRAYVIECSSFQIDLAPSLAPSVGILLNITPDHLDRHGTMANYAAIKERLISASALAVIGVDDDFCRAIACRRVALARPLQTISVERILEEGWSWEPHCITLRAAGPDGSTAVEARIDLSGIGSLRGAHTAQNAAAAVAAAMATGVDLGVIRTGLASFPGLAHRMEQVGRAGKVLFVNDSKATNADATEKALSAFDGGIHWIVGGKAKEGGIAPLAPFFPRIARAYLIGASSDEFAATLEGKVPYEQCGTLEVAVARAAEEAAASAHAEPVVLLSPACASYDQFRNFEVRGDRFRDLVLGLPGLVPFGKE